ncbi:ethionine resistance protein [Coemansia sp. RSA 2049]|nr:ethionine resistance protein [Coemansia sp. Benny D160-2]KAJ2513990.1 ethionine resistance protein [Coemansia sp. RSA 1939]KAJ2519601.1 ethionine resistance protein [Coemansia sp. RSA 2049]KAJ2607009.1 ethionine resistance protein [Coemansia sp. RSA 1804]KAJ2693145.1 ethionine resistance protein [Coemansia sp. RSA 1285]
MSEYYRLAIPSLALVWVDWIAWEGMVIAASYLGNTTLAAQSIVINTCPLTYQGANGLRMAVSSRTGNLLGQARARRAEISSSVGLTIGFVCGLMVCAGYIAVASWWGHIYTEDPAVIATVAVIMPLCGIFQLLDYMYCVSTGVLRSIGRQAVSALIGIPSYYILGLPITIYLTYGQPAIGVNGLWIGLCISVFAASLGQIIICLRADYNKEVEKCLDRISKTQDVLTNEEAF